MPMLTVIFSSLGTAITFLRFEFPSSGRHYRLLVLFPQLAAILFLLQRRSHLRQIRIRRDLPPLVSTRCPIRTGPQVGHTIFRFETAMGLPLRDPP